MVANETLTGAGDRSLRERVSARHGPYRLGPPRAVVRWCAAAFSGLARRPMRALTILGLLALTTVAAGVAGTELRAAYHFRAARFCVEHCHNIEARRHLEVCRQVWPRDPAVLLLAARTARRLEAFDEAERFLDRYRQVGGRSDDLTLERALLRAERGQMDDVTKYCQSLVEGHDPATPLVAEALAHGYLRAYRLQEAELCLRIWQDRQPDSSEASFLRGEEYDLGGRANEAVASFRRAIELDPEHDPARLQLARLLLGSAQPGEALPNLEYLLRRRPDDPEVRVYLARCQDQLGHEAEAVSLLDDVLRRNPNYPPALAERGTLALRDGDVAAAENWLRQATTLDPGDSQTRYQFWQCLLRVGKAAEAEKEHARLQQLIEDNRRFQELLTRIQQSPHDPALRYEMGLISLRAGSTRESLRWLESALAADPHYAPAHRALASYYQQAGESVKAARHRRLADEAGLSSHSS